MTDLLSVPLDFSYDEKFQEDLRSFNSSDSRRAEALVDRCEAIRTDPFKGEWKRWAMDGLYGLHAHELVILYQLVPNLSPNSSPTNVDEIYFWRIVHHDEQQTAVRNLNESGFISAVDIRMSYEDVPELARYANALFDCDFLVVDDDQYTGDGATFICTLIDEEDAEEKLKDLLPDGVDIDVTDPSVSDVVND